MKFWCIAGLLATVMGASACAAEGGWPFYAFDNIAVKGEGTLEQKLDELKALGYDGLSWSGTDVAAIRKVIKAAEERGLKVYTLYVGFTLTKDGLQEPGNLEQVFEALAGHGTMLWAFVQSRDYAPSDAAGDAAAVPALQRLADRAAKHKLRVALYPHHGFWAQTYPDCLRVARKVGRENLGVSFNLCHVLKTGDEANVPALLKESGQLLFMVSLNGAEAGLGTKGGWDKLIQPIGRGSYDVAALLRLLKEVGYAGPVGFQGYAIAGDRKAILAETMEGWKRAGGDR